jgi:integrase
MSRRIIVSAGTTEPEIRQRGYVYQKGRRKSDPWLPTQRAYGFFRMDVPGQTKQTEVRIPLGFCRDRMIAMLKLHEAMQEAGVLDAQKIRERITPLATFEAQAAWWLAEIKAGRIVNSKTRKAIRTNTIDAYSTAIAYLNGVIGNKPLASLDNPEARELVCRMKAEKLGGELRFDDKTIVEFFRVFRRVIASARDERLREVYPREWDLAYIGLPKVNKREQHRPTFTPKEVSFIVANAWRRVYKVLFALLAGSGLRIGELLALEIGKHISADCSVVRIHQQRDRWGRIQPTPKTEAGFRDVDLHPSLADMLRSYIGERESGFLFESKNGTMFWPGTIFRDGLKPILKKMGRNRVRFHAFRRFREATLQRSEVRQILIDYWMGHENADMSSRYGKQLTEDAEFRHQWAEKVGLGFELPQASESFSGLNCATCATNSVAHECNVAA